MDLEDDGLVIAPTFAQFSIELCRRLTARTVHVNDQSTIMFPSSTGPGDYWLV